MWGPILFFLFILCFLFSLPFFLDRDPTSATVRCDHPIILATHPIVNNRLRRTKVDKAHSSLSPVSLTLPLFRIIFSLLNQHRPSIPDKIRRLQLTMSSSESTPFLDHEHGDLEARPSKVGQGYHGMKLKVSFDNPTRREIRRFFSSLYGHYLVLILVSIDVGCIFADFLMSLYICDHSGDKSNSVSEDLPYVQDALQVIGIVFSCLFMVELLASIWAFGLR